MMGIDRRSKGWRLSAAGRDTSRPELLWSGVRGASAGAAPLRAVGTEYLLSGRTTPTQRSSRSTATIWTAPPSLLREVTRRRPTGSPRRCRSRRPWRGPSACAAPPHPLVVPDSPVRACHRHWQRRVVVLGGPAAMLPPSAPYSAAAMVIVGPSVDAVRASRCSSMCPRLTNPAEYSKSR
jgi:hypothetical protein